MLTYEIEPLESGGWSMAVMQDGEEIAGGAFPAGDDGYICQATWHDCRGRSQGRSGWQIGS